MQLTIGLHPDETVLPWIIVGTEVGVTRARCKPDPCRPQTMVAGRQWTDG